jgi:hypothetical protein
MVYKEAEQLLEKTLGVDISGMQIQRLCNHYGQELDTLIKKNCSSIIPKVKSTKEDDPVYVMMDGSMIYTRDEDWKELKLGSIFYDSQVIDIQSKRREICDVVYVSHLGSIDNFFPKFERHLVGYNNKVILGDGARWIWKWAEDNYPGATQILDFFHAKEKLVIFAGHHFKDDDKRKEWLEENQVRLLNNEVEKVIEHLGKMRSKPESKIHKQKAIQYFIEHEDRMQYKTYLENNLLIGSGPIEAAHRSVIQQRMKLSGQKWSAVGANAMATLRCYNKSNAWNLVTSLIRAAA